MFDPLHEPGGAFAPQAEALGRSALGRSALGDVGASQCRSKSGYAEWSRRLRQLPQTLRILPGALAPCFLFLKTGVVPGPEERFVARQPVAVAGAAIAGAGTADQALLRGAPCSPLFAMSL